MELQHWSAMKTILFLLVRINWINSNLNFLLFRFFDWPKSLVEYFSLLNTLWCLGSQFSGTSSRPQQRNNPRPQWPRHTDYRKKFIPSRSSEGRFFIDKEFGKGWRREMDIGLLFGSFNFSSLSFTFQFSFLAHGSNPLSKYILWGWIMFLASTRPGYRNAMEFGWTNVGCCLFSKSV